MKLAYKLLLAAVVGGAGGYFAAPYMLPPLLEAIYGSLDGGAVADNQPVTDTVADTSATDGADKETKKEDKAPGVQKDDSLADNEDPDAFDDDAEEEVEEEADDDDTPRRLASYKRAGEDDGRRPVNEPHFTGKISSSSWKQPKTLERRLASGIRSRMKGTTQEKIEAMLQNPEVRLMLAQWELLSRCDLDALAKLMSDRETCDDLSKLLNDLKWVSAFVYDGELTKPEVALSMIRHFRQVDPNMDAEALTDGGDGVLPGLKRRVAAAIAVEFTRNGWYGEERELTKEELESFKDLGVLMPTLSGEGKKAGRNNKKDIFRAARERYLYFAESIDQDRLNSAFALMPDWLLHFPCGWKGDSPFGTASTMRWLRDNCSVRTREYASMASHVPYLPTNVYGDSIFTKWYYEPFNVLYPGNFAKETRDVGAVCGGLSHFGTSSACANGVPAVTMGEPGHCAYAVYIDGKWVPCNSLFDKHSPHWKVWGQNTWSSFQMMTSMYQMGARTRDAQMVCTLASVLAAHKNPVKALKLYEMSVQMQPLNQPVWTYYIETAAKALSRSPRKWLGVNEFVCTSIAPEHPEMCAAFLTENIYPSMLKTLRTPKQKLTSFEAYFKNININEEAQWDIDKMLDMQYASLGKSRVVKTNFFKVIIDHVAEHPSFGMAVTWAIRTAFGESKKVGKDMVAHVRKQMETTPDKELLSAAVIRAAEEISDFELAAEWSEPYMKGTGDMPSFEPTGGNLVSAGGLVHLDDYANDQRYIINHAAALTEAGGHIKSEAGKHQHVVVELEKNTRIGGIVIVPRGSAQSYRVWKLEISTDGKSWKTIADLPDSSPEKYIRICFKHNQPTARFIRIDSGEDQNVGIDFKAILVYDNKKGK